MIWPWSNPLTHVNNEIDIDMGRNSYYNRTNGLSPNT